MGALFLKILNMSITAGYIILGVMAVRLLLKKAPKKYAYLLWSIVGFRLVCPVTFVSELSIFNLGLFRTNTVPAAFGSRIQYVAEEVVSDIAENTVVEPAVQISDGVVAVDSALHTSGLDTASAASAVSYDLGMSVAAAVWCVGVLILLVYGAVSYIRLRRRMEYAVLLKDNVYRSDQVRSPFILGFIRSKIYIPFRLEEHVQEYVLAHERYHLKRCDHIIKPIAFLVLAVHWFNPLCWVAFYLMSKDMEMSCDEKVLADFENKKVYSTILLSFAANRRFPSPSPLAFGETGVSSRIKNVLHWKKPGICLTVLAMLICGGAFVALISNPDKDSSDYSGENYKVKDVVYESLFSSSYYDTREALTCTVNSDKRLMLGRWSSTEEKWQEGLLDLQFTIELTEENFDRHFMGYGEDISYMGWKDEQDVVGELRKNNRLTWKAVHLGEVNTIYYLLFQENGQIYLFYGNWGRSNSERVKEVLETDQDHLPEDFLFWRGFEMTTINGVACYIGSPWQQNYYEAAYYPEGQWDFAYDELPVEVVQGEDITLEFAVEWDCEALTVGEDYYTAGGYIDMTTYELQKNEKNTFILEVEHRKPSEREKAIYYVMHGNDKYIIKVGFEPWSEEVQVQEVEAQASDTLDTAINQAILEHGRSHYTMNHFACASHVTLGSLHLDSALKDGANDYVEQVIVYVMALYQEYSVKDGKLKEEAGSHMPVALTFQITRKDAASEYSLLEYWIPEDGSGYKTSIEEKFPAYLSWEELDTQTYIQAQVQNTYAQAVNHFGLDTEPVIEALFEELMDSPLESSDPFDYIEAHPLAYRELMYYRDYTLQYIYEEFLAGDQTGLKGQLMLSVMKELMKDEAQYGVKEEEPQAYFDKWMEVVEILRWKKEYPEEYMKEHMREAWVLLEMLGF